MKTPFAAIASALGFATFLGAYALWFQPAKDSPRSDPLFSREVVAYEVLPALDGGEAVVKYEYKGEKLSEKLVPDEVVEKRTEFSYTRAVSVDSEGVTTYNSIFYTRPTFVQDGSDWYLIEHATTTETAFNAARQENAFASLFWRKAYAATASPYSEAGDGDITVNSFNQCTGVGCCNLSTNWGNARSDTGTNAAAQPTPASALVYTYAATAYDGDLNQTTCQADIYRTFLPFNTGSIPSGATISAATLNVYVSSKQNDVNDGFDYVTVVRTSQSTHTTLAAADYDQCGSINSPTEGIDSGQRKDITSVSTSAYLVFTLNSTGLGWIAKSGTASNCSATSGISCFGLREGHDTTNTNPSTGGNFIDISTSEASSQTQDPYLSVTYTGGDLSFWQFQDF